MAIKNHHLNKHKLEVKKPPMKKKVKLLLDDDKPLLKNMVKLGHQVVKHGVLLDYQKINVQFIFRSCKSIKLKKKHQKNLLGCPGKWIEISGLCHPNILHL